MALIEVSGLSKAFGGVMAVEDVSFRVEPGIVYSVIGPNGAGKTTLFNLITGVYQPSAGEIRLEGRAVGGLPPHVLAGMGMARTFQNLKVCMNMSAVDNVMVGAHLSLDRNLFKGMLRFPALGRADKEVRARARELMSYVGLEAFLDAAADAMPYGALKRMEIARALASRLIENGLAVVSGGTDSHVMLVDLRPKRATGKAAEQSLERALITTNKNGIPFDPEKPMITSGVRLGSPACTTRGFGPAEFRQVADLICEVLDGLQGSNGDNSSVEAAVAAKVEQLTARFPIYS